MKISHSKDYVFIDFEAGESGYGLLVIDDFWDRVKAMIVGFTDKITGYKNVGLDIKCINYEDVENYLSKLTIQIDPLEKTLFLLPWMVHGTNGINGITYCNFPETKEQLTTVLQSHNNNYGINGWIFIIDMFDDSKPEERNKLRFDETWNILNDLGYPEFVRSRITRGGINIDPWVRKVPVILKEPPGDYPDLKPIIKDWLLSVQGQINANLFQSLTNVSPHNPKGLYHNPSEFLSTNAEDSKGECRLGICAKLSNKRHDLYGVWRWCCQEACLSLPSIFAAHRWLACKAFQTSDITLGTVPVTAVIAICEGAYYLREDPLWIYSVNSPLLSIPNDGNIDKLKALGCIILPSEMKYGEFATALRNWLIHPEHFKLENSRIKNISITIDPDSLKSIIEMEYSGNLPDEIFINNSTGRRGRVKRSWDDLRVFSTNTSHSSNIVRLEFN